MKCTNKLITFRSNIARLLLIIIQIWLPLRAEIQESPASEQAVEVKSAVRTLNTEEVVSAIRESLGSSAAAATVEVLETSQNPLPPGKLEFSAREALPPPAAHPENPFLWRGKVTPDNGARTAMCWARVRVFVKRQIVRVNDNYQAGQMLGPEQLSNVEAIACPLLTSKDESVSDYAGLSLKRSVHALSQLTKDMVEPPPLIRRGDKVQVEAVAGQAHIIFDAEAHSNGREGQSIELTNSRSGHAFRGVVSAKGMVLVFVPQR